MFGNLIKRKNESKILICMHSEKNKKELFSNYRLYYISYTICFGIKVVIKGLTAENGVIPINKFLIK